MLKKLLLALQFLTIIPVRIKEVSEKEIAGSMIFFPVIGLFLALVLVAANYLLLKFSFPEPAISICLIVILIIMTGGLHLDGLADTVDAFSSNKDKEGMLKVMRDSHIGAMGVVGIIAVILLKIAFLSSLIPVEKIPALILACVISRWMMVFSMFLFPYAREEGKAGVFIRGINIRIFLLATALTLISILLTYKLKSLFIIIAAALLIHLFSRFIKNKLGGITGDTLGAINELTEVIVLFSMAILGRINL